MLKQVLAELESAGSALNLNDLSRRLGIERSALEGMVAYLVQKGKLQDDEKGAVAPISHTSKTGETR